MCWHLILICHLIVTCHNPKVAERKLLSVICEELVNVSRCVSPPSGYKYLHPRVNIFAPDLEPLDLQADKAADSQLAQRKKKKRKTRKKNWNEMFARGEGNTVQYPIYAHGTEAPLSAAAYIKRTSQTEFRISGTHSNTQTLAPTSEAHTLHILKRTWWAFFFYHYYYIIFEAAGCMCARVCVSAWTGNNGLLLGLSSPRPPPPTPS